MTDEELKVLYSKCLNQDERYGREAIPCSDETSAQFVERCMKDGCMFYTENFSYLMLSDGRINAVCTFEGCDCDMEFRDFDAFLKHVEYKI